MALTPEAPNSFFVLEAAHEQSPSYGYLCGSCGAPLLDHKVHEVIDRVFLCLRCGTLNEPPTQEARYKMAELIEILEAAPH